MIVLITGASSGIGRACCYEFASKGANLIILARREKKLQEITKEVQDKYKVNVIAKACDVRNYEQVKECIETLPVEWKNIDVLINNAGLARGLEKIQDGVIEKWEEMIDTNIKGLLYVTRCVLPYMIKRNYGDIINIGSIAGHEVYPGGNVYCGTKFAERAISKGMTIDTNGYNIRVCSIDPGMVETEFSLVRFDYDIDRAKSVYKGLHALTGEDIAKIASFIVSQPRHVNIQNIVLTPSQQATATIVSRNL
jgi:NADP-dependent 3-hydroxy acid dehydrogenase YdfG